jgi:hypothetical protein
LSTWLRLCTNKPRIAIATDLVHDVFPRCYLCVCVCSGGGAGVVRELHINRAFNVTCPVRCGVVYAVVVAPRAAPFATAREIGGASGSSSSPAGQEAGGKPDWVSDAQSAFGVLEQAWVQVGGQQRSLRERKRERERGRERERERAAHARHKLS